MRSDHAGRHHTDGWRVIEGDVSASIRIDGAKRGCMLLRNNSGAFEDKGGRWVRFGLGNDSKRVNELMKSSDLIGLTSGWWWGWPNVMGVFTAVESKKVGWKYTGKGCEPAQLNFINLVRRHGGVALFATSWSDVENELTAYFSARANSQRRPSLRA